MGKRINCFELITHNITIHIQPFLLWSNTLVHCSDHDKTIFSSSSSLLLLLNELRCSIALANCTTLKCSCVIADNCTQPCIITYHRASFRCLRYLSPLLATITVMHGNTFFLLQCKLVGYKQFVLFHCYTVLHNIPHVHLNITYFECF